MFEVQFDTVTDSEGNVYRREVTTGFLPGVNLLFDSETNVARVPYDNEEVDRYTKGMNLLQHYLQTEWIKNNLDNNMSAYYRSN